MSSMSQNQPSSAAQPPPLLQSGGRSAKPPNTSPVSFLVALGVIMLITEVVMFGFVHAPTIQQTITPSLTKSSTYTFIPSPTTYPTEPLIASSVNCIPWSSLTNKDVDNSICVYGRIIKIYSAGQYLQIIRFSLDAGTFLIWDREETVDLSVGQCITAEGIVHQDASELFMEIKGTEFNEYAGCP